MAALGSQTIAGSYEQLLHVDTDGGGDTTTLVPVKDGDNGTTFCLQLATTSALISGSGSKLLFSDNGGEYISGDGTDLTITSGTDILLAAGGNIGIGITTMSAPAGADPKVQIEGTDADNSSLSVWRNTAGPSGPYFTIGHSRGDDTLNSVNALVDNDILGTIQWSGGDGSDRSPVGANIFARIDGDPASNDMPAELVFGTTPDGGSAAPTERLTIHADGDITTAGNIVIDSDTKGLVLGADQDVTLYSNYVGSLLLARGTDTTFDASGETLGYMELNVGDSGASSITIAGGEGGAAAINFFGDQGETIDDKYAINVAGGEFVLKNYTNNSWEENFVIDSSADSIRLLNANVYIGDSSNANMTQGLTIQQAAADNEILALKSSDVSHPQTNTTEADTYGRMMKASATGGGLRIDGFNDANNIALELIGNAQGDSDGRSTSTNGAIVIKGVKTTGNDPGDLPSDSNILVVYNRNTARFIFDTDGDFHADSSSTTFDQYNDAQLVRAFDLSHGKGVIKSKFDEFVNYQHETLAELELVGREEDGTPNHFINVTGMQRLHNGAIWQQYTEMQKMKELMYDTMVEMLGKSKADAKLKDHDIKLLDNKNLLN